MDLGTTVAAQEPDTEAVLLTNVAYTVAETGHVVDTPIIHLRGRTVDGELIERDVVGFRPYFAIRFDDFRDSVTDITNDRRVLGVRVDCTPRLWADALDMSDDECENATAPVIAEYLSEHTGADIYHDPDPYTTIDDEPCARIYCRVPGDVGGADGMRGDLDCETFEADIPFERRFLISTEIYRGVEVPADCAEIRYENWPGESSVARDRPEDAPQQRDLTPCEAPDIETRRIVYDIEVATEGDGFPQPDRARHPITAITGWDSYEREYVLWALEHDSWDQTPDSIETDVRASVQSKEGFPDDVDVRMFADERGLLYDFNDWVIDRNPDVITGYNADGFDHPYLIQRSYNVQARNIREFTETGEPGVWVEEYNGNREVNFTLQERCTLDILDAYKKTQFRELDSYKLDAVAEAELGFGKTGLAGEELDDAWINEPVEFFTYNVRDTQATVEVERESELFDLFENLREVTGAMYETAVNNGPMLDTLFLRRAYEKGLVLPSNTEPDESVYHGAKVFDVAPGRHKNCVYPDLSSMYPNLFAMLNLGGETIIGNEDALEASEYTESDCLRFPVDERPFAEVPKGESYDHIDRDEYKGVKTPAGGLREIFDPEITWFYVLKPEIKESFVRDTVDELIELKYNFTGSMYGAVKRITNCFSPDTTVATPNGDVPITDLQVGDDVYSINPETGTVEIKPVVETKSYDYDGDLVEIDMGRGTDSGSLRLTPNHKLLRDDGSGTIDTITADMAYHENAIGPRINTPPIPVDGHTPASVIDTENGVRRISNPYQYVHCVTVEDNHTVLASRDGDCMWVHQSVYGVAGDSDSAGGKGFRLYNRRVAEGITLAGRMTITHTAEAFTNYLQDNYDEDAILVGGDTDSSVTSMPNAPDLQTAWEWAKEATEYTDESYDEFAMERFDFDDPDNHRLEVELESLASALFYMEGDVDESYKRSEDGFLIKETTESGVQKRYVQHLVWTDDEDGGWIDTADDVPLDDPENKSDLKWLDSVTYETYEDGCLSDQNPTDNLSITGFEYVRSDSAEITRDAQEQIFSDILFAETPSNRIEPYLQDLVDSIKNGDVPLEKLARPKGINNGLDEYGWKDYDELNEEDQTDEAEANGGAYVQKAGPTYRGAKYADDWFKWEDLGPGSKPRKVLIEKVRAPDEKYKLAYEYHSYPTDDRPDPPEVGDPVDAIAVEYLERIPEQFVIDYEQIVEKTLRKKLEGILSTIGMDWDDILGEGSQAGLDQWM